MNCVNHPDEDAPYQCYRCRSAICVECESKTNGRSICPACLAQIRQRIAERYEAETRNVSYGGGVLGGVLAAAAVAFLWSRSIVWTGYRMEVGAAVLGAAVGYAVMLCAGEKRGHGLQQIASVIAVVGIVSAHLLIFLRTRGAAYAFPEHLASLGLLDWLFLVLGVASAYWIPHVRSLPEQP